MNHLGKHKSTFSFLKALAINPMATGAILPSSKRLAKIMASYISVPTNTLIVELGAGTGVITEAVLGRGFSPKRIIAVEYSPHLVKGLQARFPEITVIEGNAAYLTELLKGQKQPVGTIISSLPLRSLPSKVRDNILAEIPLVLSQRSQFIQFTYDITNYKSIYPENYLLYQTTIVWSNIPPAKVNVYRVSKACDMKGLEKN
jgi:phospholipid N-methyltransferase